MSVTPAAIELPEPAAAHAGEAPRFLQRLLRRPLAVVCLIYLAAVVLVAIIAPLAMPWVAHEQAGDLLNVRRGPSWSHWLGTDSLGRDELERVLVGTRVTMVAVVEAIGVCFALGVPVGIVAGYFGGAVDRAVGWFVDLSLALPGLIIVLVVVTVFPNNTLAAMATLGVLSAPGLIRIVRSAVLPVREELYVAAARVSGLSRRYIMGRHVLPRIAGPIIVQASLFAAGAILVQVALSYLGLLSAVPAPSWGQMLGDGLQNIVLQPWLIWPPGIVVTVTTLAFGLLGDVVRDVTSEGWQAPVRRSSRTVSPLRLVSSTDGVPRDALLALDGVAIAFPSPAGPVAVVEDVSFEVRPGETVGIVGESGCGKTVTAMSILACFPGTVRSLVGGSCSTGVTSRRSGSASFGTSAARRSA
jgi:peptide/nickel transport system permease protein